MTSIFFIYRCGIVLQKYAAFSKPNIFKWRGFSCHMGFAVSALCPTKGLLNTISALGLEAHKKGKFSRKEMHT
jgi:hypothetical protein